MRFKISLITSSFLAGIAMTALAAPASALDAQVSADLNMRMGPGTRYPVVETIPQGREVRVYNCVDGYDWCDVRWGRDRGWVFADYLRFRRDGNWRTVPDWGARVDLPVISFSLGDYAHRHYRGTRYYDRIRNWARDRDVTFRVNLGDRDWNRDRDRDWDRDANRGDRDWDRDRDRNRGDRDRDRDDRDANRGDSDRDANRGDRDRDANRGDRDRDRNRDDRDANRGDRDWDRDQKRGGRQTGDSAGANADADATTRNDSMNPGPDDTSASTNAGPGNNNASSNAGPRSSNANPNAGPGNNNASARARANQQDEETEGVEQD